MKNNPPKIKHRGGRRPGSGRPKGAPNKVTTAAKCAFLAAFGRLEGDLEKWIRQTAEGVPEPVILNGEIKLSEDGSPILAPAGADPGKAADLLIRMAEYHFPKLGRTEVTGEGGGPVVHRIERVIIDAAKP